MATITAALCLATGGGSVGEWMLPVRYCRSLPGRRRSRLPGHHHRFRDLEKIVVHDLKGRRKIWRALQGAERRGTADCCRRSGDETPGLSMRISFCFMRLGVVAAERKGSTSAFGRRSCSTTTANFGLLRTSCPPRPGGGPWPNILFESNTGLIVFCFTHLTESFTKPESY